MTKLSERLEALAEKATNDELHPEAVALALFQLKALLLANRATIIEALKAKDL